MILPLTAKKSAESYVKELEQGIRPEQNYAWLKEFVRYWEQKNYDMAEYRQILEKARGDI